jgi:hypothetical protein
VLRIKGRNPVLFRLSVAQVFFLPNPLDAMAMVGLALLMMLILPSG